jgi:branched-subunit amino acid ABC-type transport system permease component
MLLGLKVLPLPSWVALVVSRAILGGLILGLLEAWKQAISSCKDVFIPFGVLLLVLLIRPGLLAGGKVEVLAGAA